MKHAIVGVVVGVGLCLAAPGRALAEERRPEHMHQHLGFTINSTSASDSAGGTTVEALTYNFRQFARKFSWGLRFEGLAAVMQYVKIGYVTDPPVVSEFIGADFGWAFRLGGGLASIGVVVDALVVQVPGTPAEEDGVVDLGGVLHYTMPIAKPARVTGKLQLTRTGTDATSGVQGSAEVVGTYRFLKHWSAFARLGIDVRSYNDDVLPAGHYSLTTVMFSTGVAVHAAGE